MQKTAADEKFLSALATAIVDNPRGTFREIAQGAGVSKATLNRFCGTRENLIEILLNHGAVVMNEIIDNARLQSAEPMDALLLLIDGHLTHREILAFLSFQWRPDYLDEAGEGARWLPYSEALDSFFLRGQREGVFRFDISAPVLTDLFASILFGLVDGARRGRVARVGMAALMQQFFLDGAAARAPN